MNLAIIAAVKVCIEVMAPVVHSTAATSTAIEWGYPAGYEQCPALIAKRNREEVQERAAELAKQLVDERQAYQRGVAALKK